MRLLLNTVFPGFQPQNVLYETLSFSREYREKMAMGPSEPGKQHSWHLRMKHWSWFKWMEATEPCAQDPCTDMWCWTATTADLVTGNSISVTQTHHSTWAEEKNPCRRRGSNPLVFSSKIKVSSLSKVDTEDLLLCILSLII